MAKAVLDALKATGAADLQAAIDAVAGQMFKIKVPWFVFKSKPFAIDCLCAPLVLADCRGVF